MITLRHQHLWFVLLTALFYFDSGIWAETPTQIIPMKDANWSGDACTLGGVDIGLEGDSHCVVVSGNNDMNYPSEYSYSFIPDKNLFQGDSIDIQIGYRANAMQTHSGRVFLDGGLLTTIDAYQDREELKVCRLIVNSASFDLKDGTHTFKFVAAKTDNQWNYFQIDAIRIALHNASSITGGRSIPYELFPMTDGNWIGDGGSWGGLDSAADISTDRAGIIVQQNGRFYPSSYDVDVQLQTDFSSFDVHFSLGYRRNQRMASRGDILWDGKPLLDCTPFVDSAEINQADSILDVVTIKCNEADHDFSSGKHRLTVKVDPIANADAMFQVDAVLVEGYPKHVLKKRFYLDEYPVNVLGVDEGIQLEALNHFVAEVKSLGMDTFEILRGHPTRSPHILITCSEDSGSFLSGPLANRHEEGMKGMKPFQRQQCYYMAYQSPGDTPTLTIGSMTHLGCVYAISNLQLRLRKENGRVFLDFSEWDTDAPSGLIIEKPVIEDRGEYLNIGYNFKNITPHEWGIERWKEYIDLLVLARLNRLYFYIWNDVYTMYPGSEFSKIPLNRQIHENIQGAIEYAHSRGLDVTYMLCPTYCPVDIWKKHPEIHAEIEYVDHGFPAVCANAPGAWDLMKDIYRSEMQWFSKANALQIWFYDPGGCWCEKHGCRQHQAESLARQFNEFTNMFREFNPSARVEFNIWPIWLWEHNLKIDYRRDLGQKIKNYFPSDFQSISAVGAPDNDTTLPLLEKTFGYKSSAFIFGTNPENGYFFLMPNLSLLSEVSNRVAEKRIDSAFGHRLEAWTRYPSTFFMGDYLWNPATRPEQTVNRFSAWVTADPDKAAPLAEALLLLDQFTYEGADRMVGLRMSELADRSFTGLQSRGKILFEYFPAMMKALSVIGSSAGMEDNPCILSAVEQFGEALQSSPTFQPFYENGKFLFEKYRGFLIKGSRKAPF